MLMHSASLYLATVLIWGTTWFAITFQLGVVAESVSLVYRFALASLILLAFCLFTRRNLCFDRRAHLFMALQGLLLFSSNYLIFYWATHLLHSGMVAVGFSTVIFMNIVGAMVVFKQRITPNVWVGAIFGLLGIGMIFWPELVSFSWSDDGVRGLFLCVLATGCASSGNLVSARNQHQGLPVIQTNAWGMGYGALIMAVYALADGATFNFDTRVEYISSLIYLSVFGSVLAFGAYLTLIGRIGADKTAYAAVLFPVVALLISSVFEDYRWTMMAALGLVLVVLGNIIVLRRPKIG